MGQVSVQLRKILCLADSNFLWTLSDMSTKPNLNEEVEG
jgi:hypothetical protein